MKDLYVTVIMLLTLCVLSAQSIFHNPDKVYLHLDRNLYAQGDTIWIKAYAMERGSNKLSDKSYAIHVQMLNEDGEQVGAYKFLTINGLAQGQIELLSVVKPGFYQLVAHTGYMKNFDQRFFFKTAFEVREKVRRRTINARFDQAAYQLGDTALVTFSVIDQNKVPVGGARFVYEYMVGDKVIRRKGVRCADDGIITLRLPIEDNGGKEKQRLHLSYYADDLDVNRKPQEISIPIKNQHVNISFFPEGGDLVEGISSKVAFKAYDDQGNGLNVSGFLYKDNEVLAPISTMHEGMGVFTLKPDQACYSVKLTQGAGIDSVYRLPLPQKQGFVLSYLAQSKDKIRLCVKQNKDTLQQCKIWVSHCDSLWMVHDYVVSNASQLTLNKAHLPGGIVTFTLSDAEDRPQAERLVYIQKEKPKLTIDFDDVRCGAKQKVDVDLRIDATQSAHLSFVVVDSVLANSPKLHPQNIMAYAELSSELKGYIPNVNQYLGSSRSIAAKRDLLLLTHTWRRFEWFDNNKTLSSMAIFDFNRIYGQVFRWGKPYSESRIAAFMLGKTLAAKEFDVDEDGRFFVDPDYCVRTYDNLMILALNKKGRGTVSLSIQNTDTLLFKTIENKQRQYLERVLYTPIQQHEQALPRLVEEPFMLYDTHVLNEFEVSATRFEWDMSQFFEHTTERKLGEELEEFENGEWLLSQTSNRVYFNGELGIDSPAVDRVIVAKGIALPPLFYAYELPYIFNSSNRSGAMIYLNGKAWSYDVSSLDFLTKADVQAVAVLDGYRACEQFGAEAYYGAILVYVHKEALQKRLLRRNQVMFGHFVRARQFASPQYSTPMPMHSWTDDNRVTLHWEPFVQTDSCGYASVSFYTGDILGQKQIIVQGVDCSGNLYYEKAHFEVKDSIAQ